MKLKENNILKILTLAGLFGYFILTNYAGAAADDFDLVWSAKTYTPTWYQGRALATIESWTKASVINPNFSSSNLVYDWYVNFEKDVANSGLGKNSFLFRIKNYDDCTITAAVSDKNGNKLAEKSIILSAARTKPSIIFYQEDPVLGTKMNQALTETAQLAEEKISLKAEPFFFTKQAILSYNWKMNGQEVLNGNNENILNLQKTSADSGSALITLKIQNLSQVLQQAEENLRINF